MEVRELRDGFRGFCCRRLGASEPVLLRRAWNNSFTSRLLLAGMGKMTCFRFLSQSVLRKALKCSLHEAVVRLQILMDVSDHTFLFVSKTVVPLL